MLIKDFLDARAGADPFYWTPPLGTQALFRCDSYQTSPLGAEIFSLTATFEQAFHP